ncbi:MAG: hypothetical protein LUI04_01950 [Porphyromonadaceae bacterium]|nr:hypothetical protein [Porphyromonadaceae bacterium]
MEKKEAMMYLALGIQARKGNDEAKRLLEAEEKLRAETGRPSLQEEMLRWADSLEKKQK